MGWGGWGVGGGVVGGWGGRGGGGGVGAGGEGRVERVEESVEVLPLSAECTWLWTSWAGTLRTALPWKHTSQLTLITIKAIFLTTDSKR